MQRWKYDLLRAAETAAADAGRSWRRLAVHGVACGRLLPLILMLLLLLLLVLVVLVLLRYRMMLHQCRHDRVRQRMFIRLLLLLQRTGHRLLLLMLLLML